MDFMGNCMTTAMGILPHTEARGHQGRAIQETKNYDEGNSFKLQRRPSLN